MAKKVKTILKLQIEAGKATPAPPIGPALGQHGVNIMGFVKEYNEKTASSVGDVIPVEITIYQDNSFSFILKTPPTSALLKKEAGIEKGSGGEEAEPIGSISKEAVKNIAEKKMADLNAADIDGAIRIIEGTARSMGITIDD